MNGGFGLAAIKREGWYSDYLTGESISPFEHAVRLIRKQPFFC